MWLAILLRQEARQQWREWAASAMFPTNAAQP